MPLHLVSENRASTDHSHFAEIAVGYFSSLELTTDFELSVSLVREMSHFARLALERGNNEIGNGIGGDLDTYRNITELSRDTFPNNCVSEPAEFDIYVSVSRFCISYRLLRELTQAPRRTNSSAPYQMRHSKCGALYSRSPIWMILFSEHDDICQEQLFNSGTFDFYLY